MTPGRDLIRSTGRIFDEPPLILLTWRIQQSNTLRIGHRLTSRLDLLSSLCSFPNHFLHFPTVSTVNLWFGHWNNLLWFLFLRASLLSLAVYMQTDEWEGYWERAAMERSLQIKTPASVERVLNEEYSEDWAGVTGGRGRDRPGVAEKCGGFLDWGHHSQISTEIQVDFAPTAIVPFVFFFHFTQLDRVDR